MGKKRQTRNKPNRYLTEDEKKNELFHHYYKIQFNWDDEQIKCFYETMLSELPATFRVTGFREHSKEVLWLIKNKFLEQLIDETKDDNGSIISRGPLAKALPWYPNEMAWQLNASKVEIRKTPELKRLHKFMISETDCGFISRQEAVSMIPPLLLDIEPHHKVLDLCAAPGSKTAQLIEMLHSNCDSVPTGVVVANDIDSKRCYMMVHQLQRLQSPCAVVVRQDASIFPKMYLPNTSSKTGQSQMMFDRILADVPCSGDGTLRKNPDLWPRWNPFLGVNEHFLQSKILRRSLEMLAEGGRMVYSTCSLNPIEDEAVIAGVLSQCQGSVKLIDIHTKLPDLVAEPGMSSWKVMLKDKTWCNTINDVPIEQRRSLRPSLFPPANVDELHLEYCRRVLPQLQNTGGFFIALLEKSSCLPWMNASKLAPANDSSKIEREDTDLTKKDLIEEVENQSLKREAPASTSKGPAKKKARVFKEDPFFYMDDSDESWHKLKEYYDLADSFPHRQLMYRNADGKRRNYYFTNDLVKQLVQTNVEGSINFVNLGVKAFGISEDKMFQGYRLLQEGIEIVEPYVGLTRRRLTLPRRADLVNLLTYDTPLITTFSEQLNDDFTKLSVGPVLFQYDPSNDTTKGDGDEAMPRIPLVFAGWRGHASLRHYVGVHERSHLLRLCGLEVVDVAQATRNGDGLADVEEDDMLEQSDVVIDQSEEVVASQSEDFVTDQSDEVVVSQSEEAIIDQCNE